MEEVIWVEVLSRHRDVLARHRFAGPEIRIGRGYDNDVVIDDPYVAARHVRLRRDESGALIAEDVGSANGMFVDHGKQRVQRIVIDGDRPIRIGNTFLRIRDARHAVPHEREHTAQTRTWPIVLALGAAILAIELASVWLKETGEPKVSSYVQPLVGLCVFALGWTAVWAVLSRVFSGQARFERNLYIALVGILAYSLYNEVAEFVGFSLTWRALAAYGYVALWCVLAAVCFFHLREIGPSRLRLKAAAVVALLAIGIAMQTLTLSELRADFGQQNPSRRLLPPVLRMAPVHPETIFFGDIERLKSKLDRDRKADPSSGGAGAILDDDD